MTKCEVAGLSRFVYSLGQDEVSPRPHFFCELCSEEDFIMTFWGPIFANRYPCRGGYPLWQDNGLHVIVPCSPAAQPPKEK